MGTTEACLCTRKPPREPSSQPPPSRFLDRPHPSSASSVGISPDRRTSMAKAKSGGWLDNIKTIVYAGLIAIVIRTVAFEPFNIPSGSMIPTLLVGDYLFVSKFSYGYSRYSMPFSPAAVLRPHLRQRAPCAAMWPCSRTCTTITSTDYIKRIVGLPGDHIQVRRPGNVVCERQPGAAPADGRFHPRHRRKRRLRSRRRSIRGDAARRRQAT